MDAGGSLLDRARTAHDEPLRLQPPSDRVPKAKREIVVWHLAEYALAWGAWRHDELSPPRWGELAALRRCDIDLRSHTIQIHRSLTEKPSGGYLYGPPKSDAGRRRVVFPAHIAADLESHLAAFVTSADDA